MLVLDGITLISLDLQHFLIHEADPVTIPVAITHCPTVRSKSRKTIKYKNNDRYWCDCESGRVDHQWHKCLVSGCFLFCWIPFFTCNVLSAISMKVGSETLMPTMSLFIMTTWLGYVNSALNPVIYTLFNHEFRKAFKKMLCINNEYTSAEQKQVKI